MKKIIQQKISADHLLYVSLKYTKTTEVMLNLISRWKDLIETATDRMLEEAKKNKKIKNIPIAPLPKIKEIRKLYKNKTVKKMMDIYEFFRKIKGLDKTRGGEFRKNVALSVQYKGEWVRIDMDKLKEYNEVLENFLEKVETVV